MEKSFSRDSDSDSDYAFQLQMEEAFAASLISQSRTPHRPPSPPIVARCGYAVVQENDQNVFKPPSPPIVARCGYAVVEENDQKGLKPPSPPIVARSGYAVVEENDMKDSKPKADLPNVRTKQGGFDFRKAIGEGNSKGKGKIQETRTGDERKPDIGVGNTRNTDTKRPSPVQETVRPPHLRGEGSSKVNSAAAQKFHGHLLYRLYSKGLVSEETGKGKKTELVAGFGFAICDTMDNLLFEMKGPLVGRGMNRQGADVMALTRGLTKALKLGIKQIAFCCDSYPIFQFVTRKWMPKQKKVSLLLDDLHRIRRLFPFCQSVLVAGHDVKFAYKLARESIVSQVIPHYDPRQAAGKEECAICFNDIDAGRMFSVDKCRHRFCFLCVKQHVEVKLLHAMVPNCPHVDCKSELVIDACGKLLTPKLSELWQQRIKENAIPVTERVYCPYPKCSALMSKSKISESAKSLLALYSTSGARRCVECRSLFCVECKVPWHGKLSCTEYKKLHPNPPAEEAKLKSLAKNKMWRQCNKCQHMIELTQGCNHITCRCGHEFCYNCGGTWNKKMGTCMKHCPAWDEAYIMRQDPQRFNEARFNAECFSAMLNSYFGDDDDEDYDYDGDFNYNDYRLYFGDREEPFDPFFDLPDGVIFTPDMLSPRSRQRYYENNSDEEETGKSHVPPHNNGPFGNAPPATKRDAFDEYFGEYGKYATVYDSDGYEIEDYTNPFHPDYL